MAEVLKKPRIERLPPLPPPDTWYHPIRKRIHLICVAIFVVLPFFNLMRCDIPRQRFYFMGFELWINEFAILFFTMMFLMFVIAASAIMHGRLYCSYMCPQMIFSEWSIAVENWSRKLVKKRNLPAWTANAIWYGLLLVVSVFLAFVFTAYFVEPRDLLSRLAHFDIVTAGGITGAVVTLMTFLDLTLVRQNFCTTVCPYGYLQGMLQDKETLLVVYQDPQKVCIECKKCVRVCEMDIDIRTSPFQIECIHCGDCIDACEDVMRKVGRPGLIHYAFGENDTGAVKEPWYKRLGFRDAKRVAITLVLLCYLGGLLTALSVRRPVLVRIAPDRSTLYTFTPNHRVANTMRMTLANRGGKTATVKLWAEGLPGAQLALPENPITLKAGETLERRFEVSTVPFPGSSDVNHFRLMALPSDQYTPDVFDVTFIMPVVPKE